MSGISARDRAAANAAQQASACSDTKVAAMLEEYAADIEATGRSRAPQWMREAAKRLRRGVS